MRTRTHTHTVQREMHTCAHTNKSLTYSCCVDQLSSVWTLCVPSVLSRPTNGCRLSRTQACSTRGPSEGAPGALLRSHKDALAPVLMRTLTQTQAPTYAQTHMYVHMQSLNTALHFLAFTETWIPPENSATPAALSTAFSHTPRPSGRGGGTGLLISPKWSYQVLSLEHLA